MIWESKYWKSDLIHYAKKLESRIQQKKWFDVSNANAEKEIMISAFIVRKLFESRKIAKNLENKKIPIVKYKNNDKKIHYLQRLNPDRYFDLEYPIVDEIKCRDLINNIIHSYIFLLLFEDKEFKYFWVSSDYNKFEYVIQIEVKDYIKVIQEVGEFWPTSEMYKFNLKKNDYDVVHNPITENNKK